MPRVASRTQLPRTFAGRPLVLLVALAGLLAMHGLYNHGAAGPVDHADAALSAPHVDTGHADLALGAESDMPDEDASTSGAFGNAHHSGTGLMVGLCLAVLGLSLFALALARAGRGWPLSRFSLPGLSHNRTPARARAPDPPSLIRLSIQRC